MKIEIKKILIAFLFTAFFSISQYFLSMLHLTNDLLNENERKYKELSLQQEILQAEANDLQDIKDLNIRDRDRIKEISNLLNLRNSSSNPKKMNEFLNSKLTDIVSDTNNDYGTLNKYNQVDHPNIYNIAIAKKKELDQHLFILDNIINLLNIVNVNSSLNSTKPLMKNLSDHTNLHIRHESSVKSITELTKNKLLTRLEKLNSKFEENKSKKRSESKYLILYITIISICFILLVFIIYKYFLAVSEIEVIQEQG